MQKNVEINQKTYGSRQHEQRTNNLKFFAHSIIKRKNNLPFSY
jgi:hypothetical protein